MTMHPVLPGRTRWAGGALVLGALLLFVGSACSSPSSGSTGRNPSDAGSGDVDGGTQDGDEKQSVLDVAGRAAMTRPIVEIPADWDSAIDEVYGRYWLYWEAFAAAYGPPNVDPSYAPLRTLSTDSNWESLQEQLLLFVEDGLILVLPDQSITQHLLRIPNASVLSDEEGAELVLQDCWLDDFVQQTVDGRVLEVTKEAKLMNVSMKVVAGEWRVDGVTEATPESDGYAQCEELL